jgi:O-methyltransferase involved in polyketide biosynthesis
MARSLVREHISSYCGVHRQPTLIIAECVLIYLEPHVSRAVVKWAADKFETAAFVIYEQVSYH